MRTRFRAGLAVVGVVVWLAAASAAPHRDAGGGAGDRWTREELEILASLHIERLSAHPADPSNRYDASPAAIELGHALFADSRLSANGAVACATCHDPSREFQDGRPVSIGVGTGTRRAMPIVGAGHGAWLFWDGRKDSLWSQALGPLEDPREHASNRMRIVRLVARNHRDAYVAAFGDPPDFAGFPEDASPLGSDAERAAWLAMPAAARDEVSRAFANVGKAIAAYEKTLRPPVTRFDRYVAQLLRDDDGISEHRVAAALDASERRGLRLFIGKGQCVTCHAGPLLTDQQFHNTGVPSRAAASPDRGRAQALRAVLADEFNCLGRFSDAAPERCAELQFLATDDVRMEGAFKTPGLRGVARRAPYMHAGQLRTLDDVVAHYAAAPAAAVGRTELTRPGSHALANMTGVGRKPIVLSPAERRDLVAFLESL